MQVLLENLENFMTLLHEVQKVKRMARRPGETEPTNTAEHTFEIAMISWYVASCSDRKLNLEKVLLYSLVHDLIEAYAGDTFIYDKEKMKTKVAREHAAYLRIKNEFKEFPVLGEMIEAYEKRKDEESRFVYALDKLVDPLNISMEKGTTLWKEEDISYQQIRDYKDEKIATDSTVQNIWNQLIDKLESNPKHYFPD